MTKKETKTSDKTLLCASDLLLKSIIGGAIILLISLSGCDFRQKKAETQRASISGGNLSSDKVSVQHAKGFSVDYFDQFKVLKIFSASDRSADTICYLLQPAGNPIPAGFEHCQRIEVPVKSLVLTSSTHLGLLTFLGMEDVVVGLGSAQYVFDKKVLQRIAAGKIREVGKDQGVNEEKLLEMHPDLLMATGSPGAGIEHFRLLREAGIPVIINYDWMETSPLGRAEWVKLMAVLLNKEAEVNVKFSKIESEYHRLAALAATRKIKPSVVTGMHYKDAWFVPGGRSFMADFFRDAGASYHWSETGETGSLSLSFETVYQVALNADFWLNVDGGQIVSRDDITSKDVRYRDFKSVKTGRVYGYFNRVNEQGANDYWESGSVNPHLILSDMIRIFHPDLLPGHELIYYKQVK